MADRVCDVSGIIHRIESCLTEGRNKEMADRDCDVSGIIHRTESCLTEGRRKEMADRVCNVSDIIHRIESCLTEPYAGAGPRLFLDGNVRDEGRDEDDSGNGRGNWEDDGGVAVNFLEKMRQMEAFIAEVFDAVSTVKKAYVALQEAHCPWDPDRIRVADAGVIAELRKLLRLRDRFRRGIAGEGGGPPNVAVAAKYEAAPDFFRREIKAKEVEIEKLKEKLRSGRRGRTHSSKRVGCMRSLASPAAPTPELFKSCMEQVKSASKSFTAQLLSLMRATEWDLAAAARSIIDSAEEDASPAEHAAWACIPAVQPQHAKHVLESFLNRKLFDGFENETFYLEGSLTSLLRPAEFRRDCFAQFLDMHAMDPTNVLGILPTCQFGRFAGKKYLAVVHRMTEESLFGGAEQRRSVAAGGHPRTAFYGCFLWLAKAVWLLHLLAFALDPAPSQFDASVGAEFRPEYMESVVKLAEGRKPPEGAVVGFSVSPGFKLGNGVVVRPRVFVVPHGS